MVANNWTICPKCYFKQVHERKLEAENLEAEAKQAYGQVSMEDHRRLLLQVESARTAANKLHADFPETLREDYEIGIDDNDEFSVDFAARCTTCGFKFEFKHTQKVKY